MGCSGSLSHLSSFLGTVTFPLDDNFQCVQWEALPTLLQKLSCFKVRLKSALDVRWVRVSRAQLLLSLVSKCSICPNQCTLISTTTKKWNVCQAVMLNTALFCIPTHNEACHIYSLLLLAFVFCIALSSLQKSTKSYDWREHNKLVSLSGTAPV